MGSANLGGASIERVSPYRASEISDLDVDTQQLHFYSGAKWEKVGRDGANPA